MRLLLALLFALGTAMAGCGDDSSSSGVTNDKTGAGNGSCQGAMGLGGTGQSGANCTDAGKDCAPTCCMCDNGVMKSWASASCVMSKCAAAMVTCARTKDNSTWCTQ
jgi:hypothetical protein